jgi:hypothetical protein
MTPVFFNGIYHPFRRALSPEVNLYSAASVHPEVLEAVLHSLLSAKLDLRIASLALACALHYVSIVGQAGFAVISKPQRRTRKGYWHQLKKALE